jgi:hypothetical protein
MGNGEDSRFAIDFDGDMVPAARVTDEAGLSHAVSALGIGGPHPVVVFVGGAGGLDDAAARGMRSMLVEAVLPVVIAGRCVVVDGGTDAGIMRLLGQIRSGSSAPFTLLGVAAEKTVVLPGRPAQSRDAAPLEPHHSHFLLVPGTTWGDESSWLARTATAIAGPLPLPSVTVLVNGGEITFSDASHSLDEDRPVLVLAGTGRTADRIAAAYHGDGNSVRAARIAASPRVHVASGADPGDVKAKLEALLSDGPPAAR